MLSPAPAALVLKRDSLIPCADQVERGKRNNDFRKRCAKRCTDYAKSGTGKRDCKTSYVHGPCREDQQHIEHDIQKTHERRKHARRLHIAGALHHTGR